MKTTVAVFALASAALLAGCEASKSSNPLSPSVAGPIPGVNITPPKLLEPATGWEYRPDQSVALLIENASSNGARPLTYHFEVATDVEFSTKVFARDGIAQGDGGRTKVQLPDPLEGGRQYYWRSRALDGANVGAWASAVNFRVIVPVVLRSPTLVSPISGVRINTRKPTFTIRNSERSGPLGALSYQVQVARNDSFTDVVVVVTEREQANQTVITPVLELGWDRVYFWRSRAFDGVHESDWSAVHGFYTPVEPPPPPPPAPPAPQPSSPSPGPGPAPGGACNSSNPEKIVDCERAKYGRMSTGQIIEFLKATARSLTRNGINGAPFGILRKGGGHACNGYSCDIICSGQGTSQRQWDALGDADGAQYAAWHGPLTYPNIRVDVCEIQ